MPRPISFGWDEGFVARLDAARGDVPRSRFVRRVLERELERIGGGLLPPRPAEYVSEPRSRGGNYGRREVLPEPHPDDDGRPLSRADVFRRATRR